MLSALAHCRTRRAVLRTRFDVARQMDAIEETCIPSYLHPNWAAAGVAWARLFAAARLARRHAPVGPVLDFGAASGELAYVLPPGTRYDFVEIDDRMAQALVLHNSEATRRTFEALPANQYAIIFALDSLEHNDNVGELLAGILPALRPDGVLIVSGPTENALYRLGRHIAGFSGEYHKTTIYHIEQEIGSSMQLVQRTRLPFGLPLFSVSCWRRQRQA